MRSDEVSLQVGVLVGSMLLVKVCLNRASWFWQG